MFSHAEALVRQGFVTGASHRNWASYGADVDLAEETPDHWRHLLTDPQTSGGLLVSCAAEEADRLLGDVHAAGYVTACRIGQVEDGPARVAVGA